MPPDKDRVLWGGMKHKAQEAVGTQRRKCSWKAAWRKGPLNWALRVIRMYPGEIEQVFSRQREKHTQRPRVKRVSAFRAQWDVMRQGQEDREDMYTWSISESFTFLFFIYFLFFLQREVLSTAYRRECPVTLSRCEVVICELGKCRLAPPPPPFAALAVSAFIQRWGVGFGLAALGAGEEASLFRLLLLLFLQTWVWVRKGQAFFLCR